MNDHEAVITVEELAKTFRSRGKPVPAVEGVSFRVERGAIVGFLGPNGAGKTTTLRMLTTLLPIDRGRALVDGHDVAREPQAVRERIGYVSQAGGADDFLTPAENLRLSARLYGVSESVARRRVDQLTDDLDLTEFRDRPTRTLSGGQRRRLDVALGIVHQPAVLFLDEPSTGLDPQSRANLWEHIRRLRAEGLTVFVTTHYLDEADILSDRVLIIDHGRIVAEGTPDALKRRVAAGDLVTLEMDDESSAERIAHDLGDWMDVHDVRRDGQTVWCHADEGPRVLPDLIRRVDAAGVTLRSLNLSKPTLDDVFLHETGRSLRESEAGQKGVAGA